MPNSRPCPVCDCFERTILYRQRFCEGLLGDGYDVVVCKKCGAGFADGIPTQPELDRYYAEQSKYTNDHLGGAESEYDMRRFELIADQLEPHISREARILDIGCASGGLVSVLKKRGFLNVFGVDPSPACAAAAFRLHGIKMRTATLGQLPTWTDQFDVILMIGVLEHLRDVRAAVRTVAHCLAPNGLFYAAVPDVEGLTDSINAPFQQFSMEHLNFFSLLSLNELMRKNDFSTVSCCRWTVEWREGVTEPVASSFYKSGQDEGVHFDSATEPALVSYISDSKTRDQSARELIDQLVLNREPLLVWGAGALTRRLLIDTLLPRANIIGFIDSSTQLHGQMLLGHAIFAPEQVVGRSETIMICSIAFEKEIVALIRGRLSLSNRIITLYPKS